MALRGQIIDFVRLKPMQQRRQRTAIGKIRIVKIEAVLGLVPILKNVIDAISIEARRPTLQTMNFIPLLKKEFRQVRTVLSCAAGY